MKKKLIIFFTTLVVNSTAFAQTKGLLISEILTNPGGNDSPYEYVELLATTNINFAATPYTIVFADNGNATSNGWKAGNYVTYAFQISSGAVTAGQVVYVGGTSMAPLNNNGVSVRKINTGTTNGDSFGKKNTAGVLGNGGSNCDGVAVFRATASAITSSTVPVDALFFGNGHGSAVISSSSGYQLPLNDKYNGGKLITSSYLAPDPSSDQLVKATTGTFNPVTQTFTVPRSWSVTSTTTYNTSSVSLSGGTGNTAPTINFNTSATYLVNEASGKISCVRNNATDPVIVIGLAITVSDNDLTTLTFQMTSSSTSVVPNANFMVTGSGTARTFRINPTGEGYTTITLKVIDAGGLNSQLSFNLAVSNAVNTSSVDVYHTGEADGSTAITVDANYMFIADDEVNVIKLYNRNASGLALYSFDVAPYLNLSGTEVDIEGSFRSPTNPNRIYWIGSLSNSKTGEPRPDRNRLFATDIVGTGANATLVFVGYYSNLRSKLITWGDANGYNFTAKAASGIEPKRIDGFNIEGFEMGPNGTTAYIGFRAPYVPQGTQNKALICPLLNFETWFNNGSPSSAPSFGSPIELNLNVKGIRSIAKNANNQYLIVAGSYSATGTFELYSWNGLASSAPVLLNADLTGLSPEGIIEIPASMTGTFQVSLVSDIGTYILYNDGIENKAITEPNYRKFISSIVTINSSGKTDEESLTDINTASSIAGLIKVYPNPFSSLLTLEFGVDEKVSGKYSIYNSTGILVKENVLSTINSNKAILDLSDLTSGIYFIKPEGNAQAIKIQKQ